ncbi:MAG: ABC transporter permease subunit [Arcanobacterium sp.]|nr:ABC transporter permease subunit [Arcanobacterium sp.]
MKTSQVSFFRSLRAEFRKILSVRANLIALTLLAILHAGLFSAIILNAPITGVHFTQWKMLFQGWNLPSIFFISMGVTVITSEYANNTLRTTVLADPSRIRNFFAKALGLGTIVAIATTIMIAVTGLTVFFLWNGTVAAPDAIFYEVFGRYILGMVLFSWLGLGLGYLLRTTAGGITAGIALLYLVSLLQLIPVDFFQKTLPNYFLTNVSWQSLTTDSAIVTGNFSTLEAFAILAAYPLVTMLAGFFRYQRSDV